jgi:quinoprotein glucose dehydrogenase
MIRRMGRHLAAPVAALGLAVVAAGQGPAARQPAAPYTTWSDYGGSADSMQYSALTQIDKRTVSQLERVWFYPVAGDPVRLPFNPIVVDGVMYVAGTKGVVVALDAATGKALWTSTEQAPERGVTYWASADRSDRRLLLNTGGGLRAIDATTGKLIKSFGNAGFVDLRTSTPRPLGGPNRSPGRIFENLIIVGSNTGEGYGSPPGDLRAYDVVSGKLVWTFHTIPRPGEVGYDTWPPDAWKYAGGANTWGEITVDAKNAIVFFPTGSPTHDLYGADRAGDNLFGNCLLALDARTGKRRWHFQTVHHDLWDYDLAVAPKLLTVRHNGKPIDIVAQAGKTGFLYVFERLTGKPLWPIEERPVPKSDVPGEVSSPTQPFPTKPPPFARQAFTPEDVNPFMSADEQERLRQAVRETDHKGLFTPSSHLRHHIQFPGAWGGANWGSVAADPQTGMLFVRSLEMPSYRRMALSTEKPGPPQIKGGQKEQDGYAVYAQMCALCHGPGQAPMRTPAKLGSDGFRRLIRQGKEQMPPFPDAVVSAEKIDALEAYLLSLPLADAPADESSDDRMLRLPPNPNRYTGPEIKYAGSFSAGWYTSNGLPAVGPPWTQLVAYDLNDGTIKWRVPDGQAPGLAGKDIPPTGTVRPRNGPVVTAGGLVFVANSQDRTIRAFDRDTGKVLWSHELEANPEGIPAVYEVAGRQYVALAAGASWGTGTDPVWRDAFHRKKGSLDAQGYHVFALPESAPAQAQTSKPAFVRALDALERVTWRTRTLVSDDRLTNWNFAIPGPDLTFTETVVRADAAVVDLVEASSTQKVSAEMPKAFDATLTADEIAAIKGRMGTTRVLTYRLEHAADAASLQKALAFAKAMGAETVVVPAGTPLGGLDALADQVGINVAVLADAARPTRLLKELEGKGKRLGVGVDTGLWAQEGVSATEGLALVKERLLYLRLRDRSARGAGGRNVALGTGVADLKTLFLEMEKQNVRPVSMTLDTTSVVKAPADLFTAIEAFEAVVQPAYGVNFVAFSKTRPIRWDVAMPAKGETPNLEALRKAGDAVRQKIVAAIPRQAYATPKKRRKLLVIESLHGMSHDTIPHTNVMIEEMGKITGAWEAVFNNDLDNLKYPKVKEYDGVFLNSTVGELLPDPEVREGLARFVNEGGGLGGIHGTPWASRNWDEFAEMIGAQSAPHRIEQGVMKVYDPASPLMKPFAGKELPFREEYYRFEAEGRGRLRWDSVRVLLTVDLDDPKVEPRPWNGYKRPDNIYPVAWIRTYGRGRVFYNSLGHMTETFTTPEIVGHFLAGLQFLLGDLAADTTPNPVNRSSR